ncbi:hypothetical protein ATY30_04315 [Sinorhizobium americanum]|nr:hypothetical protein CO664_00490 [Sinorhizobium sp. NG07B]POH30766.1 hypothetical protein ATY30_04315 [Sinorhizobium americanum]
MGVLIGVLSAIRDASYSTIERSEVGLLLLTIGPSSRCRDLLPAGGEKGGAARLQFPLSRAAPAARRERSATSPFSSRAGRRSRQRDEGHATIA